MRKVCNNTKAVDVWNVLGDFDKLDGTVSVSENEVSYSGKEIFIKSEKKKDKSGIIIQKGFIKNISGSDISISTLLSKFVFDGGEYEVYTQSNFWENESRGGWSELVTQVSIEGKSVRNCTEATPFMAIWNEQRGRGFAFHLLTYSTWQMKVKIAGKVTGISTVEVEAGLNSEGLALTLKPGEQIEMPEIIYYEIRNKLDMDAYKLHNYMNEVYKRREMPVIYNTWLYKFDRINCENVIAQLKRAKEIGVEYFVIDAGWFGNGVNWWETRGDYEENLTFGFRGEMTEIAEKVREYGMKFGFWLEIECAHENAKIVKEHPEFFIVSEYSCFFDYSKKAAREYMFDKMCSLIDKFGAEFIKFDFNADLVFDSTRTGFLHYFDGYLELINNLKKRYKGLYLENCASGGMRLGLRDGRIFDSFWLSDNQSPYEGIRIYKESMLRMPPQWIECWAVIKSFENFAPLYGADEYTEKIISTDDGTITNVVGVNMSYLKAFLTGSPIGFSCDLNALSENVFSELKHFVSNFKTERAFWLDANCRILTDTETMLVLQYSKPDLSEFKIIVISQKSVQDNIRVYPITDYNYNYIIDNSVISGQTLSDCGLDIQITGRYTASFISASKSEK